MDLQLNIDEAEPGMDVWFFMKPKDPIPTLRTKIIEIDFDERGRPMVLTKGVDEWFPPYYFRKASPNPQRLICDVTMPLDDLMVRTGL